MSSHSPISHKDSILFSTESISCRDLSKPDGPILTGVGFLDHMIDQFNSHAQIGVSLTISDFSHGKGKRGGDASSDDDVDPQAVLQERNRYADQDQGKLMHLVGTKLGKKFRGLIEDSETVGSYSRFGCPLDEALVVCVLERKETGKTSSPSLTGPFGNLASYTLAPYGKFPSRGGRKYVGSMETDKLGLFWEALAEHSGLHITLRKIRGDNAHHIVEASFKAFSRAFRNLLDGTDTTNTTIVAESAKDSTEGNGGKEKATTSSSAAGLYGPEGLNWKQSVGLARTGSVSRKTKETSISVDLRLDGGRTGAKADTGIHVLNEFFKTLAENAAMSLDLTCHGDLYIDEHHTAEDVAIAVGQCLNKAFGTKAGLNRMWCASAEIVGGAGGETTKVEVTMDLSNRPCFIHNLSLQDADEGVEMVGDVPIEMFEHVLDSLVVNARMTVHVLQVHANPKTNMNDMVRATAVAFGQALKYCAMIDSRRAGVTASSKGTLSV